jgi:hypothetical protein
VNQVQSDEFENRVPVVLSGVNTENLVKPEARKGEIPKPCAYVYRQNRGEGCDAKDSLPVHYLMGRA